MSRWVTAQTFTNRSEAETARELLEQKRIEAMVRGDGSSGTDLQVHEEDLREAQSFLTEID